MIRYSPPKSQIWGHQVGRLTATELVERVLRFLGEHCTVIDPPRPQPSELMLGWTQTEGSLAAQTADEIDHALGPADNVVERSDAAGRVFRQRRWSFAAPQLPAVAGWFDRLARPLATGEAVAQASTLWGVAWRDELTSVGPGEMTGGMLGVHLGQPHRITTMFAFRDMEQYTSVKAALKDLELAELSDRHLRPKPTATPAKRRAT